MAIAVLAGACSKAEVATPRPVPADAVVVASFNFPESRLVAEIYAGALERAGLNVRRELELGPRELVSPALLQGHVDVVPEYLGTALGAADPSVVATTTPDALAALRAAEGPRHLRVLEPAPAQNQNAVVVTKDTAARLHLAATSDLEPVAPTLRLGGPPECPSRQYCLEGLTQVYGLRFGQFVAVSGADRMQRALTDDVVDVAIMFTTDGRLAEGGLVALADDRHLQPPENVVPVVREAVASRYGSRLTDALNQVSARLTTSALRLLNWRVSVGGRDPRAEATGWLTRQRLGGG